MSGERSRRGRRPGGTSSEQAVLTAARELFAERGFERATIRAIAARAGVDPAMVHHFFASKENLLDAALAFPVDPARLVEAVAANPGREGEALVERALALWEDPGTRLQFRALLRIGVSHERAGEALRKLFTRELLAALARTMPHADAELRAGLIATQMAGLALLRFIVPVDAIARADPKTIAAAVGPTLQRYLTAEPLVGEAGGGTSRSR